MRIGKALLGAFAAASLAPLATAPAHAQTGDTEVSGEWTNPDSGMVFPAELDGYHRVEVHNYRPGHWSVGYNRVGAEHHIAITLYLYTPPPGEDCRGRYESKKEVIRSSYESATLLLEDMAASPAGGRDAVAMHARFALKMSDQNVLSDVYHYCKPGSAMWVSYRSTWLSSEDGAGAAPALMRALTWPRALAD